MNYSVTWLPAALEQLTEIWLAAPDQRAVTDASYRLDATLAADPYEVGESRSDEERIAFEKPLTVFFRVSRESKQVAVISVRAMNRR